MAKQDTTSTTSAVATVDKLDGLPNSSIGVEAIDSNGDAVTPSAGTAAITVRATTLSTYQTLYESDGTTAVTIDLTDPEAVVAKDANLYGVKATPSSLSGGGAVGIRLKVTQFGG